jgi:hypothetical protein
VFERVDLGSGHGTILLSVKDFEFAVDDRALTGRQGGCPERTRSSPQDANGLVLLARAAFCNQHLSCALTNDPLS